MLTRFNTLVRPHIGAFIRLVGWLVNLGFGHPWSTIFLKNSSTESVLSAEAQQTHQPKKMGTSVMKGCQVSAKSPAKLHHEKAPKRSQKTQLMKMDQTFSMCFSVFAWKTRSLWRSRISDLEYLQYTSLLPPCMSSTHFRSPFLLKISAVFIYFYI